MDGRIFLTGKVDDPEEKLKLTKVAWETEGVRSVRNDIKIKEEFNFQQSAKDLLITSQLRTAIIINKMINKLSTKEISEVIHEISKVPKKEIYKYCLSIDNDE